MELFKAVNECMPRDEGVELDVSDITLQNKVRIQSFTTMRVADVSEWHKKFADAKPESRLGDFEPRDRTAPEKKEGYIVTLKGFHLHNNEKAEFAMRGRLYLDNTLVKNLRQWELNSGGVTVPVGKIGISHPILAFSITTKTAYDPNQRAGAMLTGGPGGMMGGASGMMGGGMMGGDEGLSGYMGGGEGAGTGAGMYGSGKGAMPGSGSGSLGMPGSGGADGSLGMPGGGAGMPGGGAGMRGGGAGGYPGMSGGGAGGAGQIGLSGPLLAEQQKLKVEVIDRTDFVVQFVWLPTLEKGRKDVDPRPPVAEDADAAKKK